MTTHDYRKLMKLTEHEEQCVVIQYCDAHKIPIFAIPNGSNKSPAQAAKYKREGLRSGIPDLMLPVSRNGAHGLFLEMKRRKNSRPSPEQMSWISKLVNQGYIAKVAHGYDEAIKIIDEYLSGKTDIQIIQKYFLPKRPEAVS